MMDAKSAFTAFLMALVFVGFCLAGVASGQSSVKVSVYILDSSGHGIGVQRLFSMRPQLFPVFSRIVQVIM